ncbi:hypothetical protein [Streptomyces sp. NPDC002851]
MGSLQRVRPAVLTAAVLLGVLVPLAGASAGTLGDGAAHELRQILDVRQEAPGVREDGRNAGDAADAQDEPAGTADDKGRDGRGGSDASEEPAPAKGLLTGIGLTAAAHCGPELASPEGVEAQTCILTQAGDTWARTYYRNATGRELRAVLTVMGPGGRTVQMHCVVAAGDEPDACETPREPSQGEPQEYTAVAEFSAQPPKAEGDGGRPGGASEAPTERPLLLRSGSNSTPQNGS